MKRHVRGLLAVALALSLPSAVMAYNGSYPPGAGINNTVHDLGTAKNGMDYTAVPSDAPLNRICIFCHAPHNTIRLSTATGGAGPQAGAEFDYLPLWNHTLQSNTEYVMYENGLGAPQTGPKASQAILLGMTPGSVSLLCLSCHDGSVAVNSYGNDAQLSKSVSRGAKFISDRYVIGQSQYLGNHHPIGFDYDAVQERDIEIRDSGTALLTPTSLVVDHLYGGRLECGSCHSVHNKGNAGETLLWRSDQNSELCLTCHDKGLYTAP